MVEQRQSDLGPITGLDTEVETPSPTLHTLRYVCSYVTTRPRPEVMKYSRQTHIEKGRSAIGITLINMVPPVVCSV